MRAASGGNSFLDDLQWGDADSAALLAEVMRPPRAPPILLIASFRDELAEKNLFIRQLIASTNQSELVRAVVALTPLSVAESALLAASLLFESGCGNDTVAAITRANPKETLFLFTRSLQAPQAPTPFPLSVGGQPRSVALDNLLWKRMELLSPSAQRLVEVVAVAGSPISEICAYRAAGLAGRDPQILSVLRNALLARSLGTDESDEIDTYHDRIRESVLARLQPEVPARLSPGAGALRSKSLKRTPEKLAFHYRLRGTLPLPPPLSKSRRSRDSGGRL